MHGLKWPINSTRIVRHKVSAATHELFRLRILRLLAGQLNKLGLNFFDSRFRVRYLVANGTKRSYCFASTARL